MCSDAHKLHKKVNLFTLVIRDKEMAESYKEARQQYFWSNVVACDILREIVMIIALLQGLFNERSLAFTMFGRFMYYLLMLVLYIINKKRPQIKDFIPIILTICYNMVFLASPFVLLANKDDVGEEKIVQFFIILPIASALMIF